VAPIIDRAKSVMSTFHAPCIRAACNAANRQYLLNLAPNRWIGMATFDLSFRSRVLNIGDGQKTNAHMSTDVSSGNDLVKNSSLYKEFQAELNEILRHKWLESEKAGRDIGFEQALTDWIMKHRSKWRKARQVPR
jgi:hypothetical protein